MSSQKDNTKTPEGGGKDDQPRPHPFFCWGDVRLLSSDNVLFTIDSRPLAKTCAVFRNMVEIAQPNSDSSDNKTQAGSALGSQAGKGEPIDIQASSTVVEKFLNMLISFDHSINTLDTTELSGLKQLWEMFECDEDVVNAAKKQLVDRFEKVRKWDLLICAGALDDRALAAKVLKGMTQENFFAGKRQGFFNFWDSIGQLPSAWQLQLLSCAIDDPVRWQKNGPILFESKTWRDVSWGSFAEFT